MLLKLLKRHFKNAQGFTLAEVLITLGIIGVVAALTLPTLIQNHKKQTYVNQLKKVVNTLENTAQMAVAQEGVSSFKDTSLYCKFFDVYSCHPYQSNDDIINARSEVIHYFKLVSYDIEDFICPEHYKKIDGTRAYPCGVKLVFPDGSIVYHQLVEDFYIDVNGEKGPNILGRDLFAVTITDNGNIVNSYCPNNVSESQYLENGCYYLKIVSDGWKMNY